MHDHGDMHTAFVSVLFVPFEWRIPALRPSPRIIRVAVRTTHIFDLSDQFIRGVEYSIKKFHFMHDTVWAAFL